MVTIELDGITVVFCTGDNSTLSIAYNFISKLFIFKTPKFLSFPRSSFNFLKSRTKFAISLFALIFLGSKVILNVVEDDLGSVDGVGSWVGVVSNWVKTGFVNLTPAVSIIKVITFSKYFPPL